MILGIGTDIINKDRIEKLMEKFGNSFYKKILSAREIEMMSETRYKTAFVAKRFAGKEAYSKALGTGFGRGLNISDVSIENDDLGKPIVVLSENGKENILNVFQHKLENIKIDISISDDDPFATAFVAISLIQ